ncbi:MAG: phosphatase PAP2 family protein [Bacilli bacterium]|nr:phosphatase PAP2 family protein [Bacilli bacterium]
MKKIRKVLKPIIFAVCLIIFVVLARLLLADKVSGFDNKVYNLVIKLKCDPVTFIFKVITTCCSMWFVALLTLLIMIFGKDKKKAYYIALNLILCFLLNQLFKYIFSRERPIGINLIKETGYSFPSGHSMMSVAFYGFIGYIFLHSKRDKKIRILVILSTMILSLLIGISRIYLGVHYASDVLAGFVLSLAYLILFVSIFYNEKKRS